MRDILTEFDSSTCCLFLDVDGTLIDIAPHPDAVVVPDDLRRNLQTLHARTDGALALISGRTIASLDALFAPLELPASGAHGAEFRFAPGSPIKLAVAGNLPPMILTRLNDVAGRIPGLLIEDKGVCVAVHYRHNPPAEAVLAEEIDRLLSDLDDQTLTVMPGHFVFEVKRAGHNKGSAVTHFMAMAPFEGRKPFVVGDDVTDETAFQVAPAFGGHGISVGRHVDSAPQLFSTAADVRRWIASLASGLMVAA